MAKQYHIRTKNINLCRFCEIINPHKPHFIVRLVLVFYSARMTLEANSSVSADGMISFVSSAKKAVICVSVK